MRVERNALALLIVLAAWAPACGCAPSPEPGANLLAGLQPTRSSGARNPQLITDGKSTPEGEEWGTSAGAVLDSERAYVDYDLGRASQIRAVYVQGDNNDGYLVSVSDDGTNFRELWTSPTAAGAGMRERMADGLAGAGRWIRLSARGGDGMYAVVEMQVYSERPAVFPPKPERVAGAGVTARVRTHLLYLVLAFALVLATAGARGRWLWLGIAAYLAVGFAALRWAMDAWPPTGRDVSFARAAAAAIALLAVFRACDCWRRFPARRAVVVGACAAAAALAFGCFYNLGRPQFWDHARSRPEFVHLPDMRIYQPAVKYFDEVRYDGVYLAGVLAYAEDQYGGSLAPLASVQVRSMRDQRLTQVSELAADIATVRARFSDKRWAAFKRDMVFFRQAMGPEYLTTLTDHGANAPPLWVLVARPLLGFTQASETSLVAAGLVDGLLFLLMAFVIARTFGVLQMCVAMTVFGANDLYMFGTNWAGATLRHDWLVLLAFAACALKTRRWTLAGAMLGVATMLRVLPAAALVGVAIPAVAWVVERWLRDRRRPRLADLLAEHQPAVRVLVAAAATMLLAFVVTGVIYGFGSWVEWWRKIVLLNRDSSVNEVNLRALVAGADAAQAWLLRSRRVIHIVAAVACIAAVVMAARRRPLHEAMLLAMPLMLVFFNPVSYHLHFICLLVLIETSRGLSGAASPLLAFCIASYWTTLDPDADRHFQLTTAMLFAALGWYYANVLRRQPSSPA